MQFRVHRNGILKAATHQWGSNSCIKSIEHLIEYISLYNIVHVVVLADIQLQSSSLTGLSWRWVSKRRDSLHKLTPSSYVRHDVHQRMLFNAAAAAAAASIAYLRTAFLQDYEEPTAWETSSALLHLVDVILLSQEKDCSQKQCI